VLQPVSLRGPQAVQPLPVLPAALPAPQSQKRPLQPFKTTADLSEVSGQDLKGVNKLISDQLEQLTPMQTSKSYVPKCSHKVPILKIALPKSPAQLNS